MNRDFYNYDVLVVGAGHAGVEAAMAAARVGARTALLTTNSDTAAHEAASPLYLPPTR